MSGQFTGETRVAALGGARLGAVLAHLRGGPYDGSTELEEASLLHVIVAGTQAEPIRHEYVLRSDLSPADQPVYDYNGVSMSWPAT